MTYKIKEWQALIALYVAPWIVCYLTWLALDWFLHYGNAFIAFVLLIVWLLTILTSIIMTKATFDVQYHRQSAKEVWSQFFEFSFSWTKSVVEFFKYEVKE